MKPIVPFVALLTLTTAFAGCADDSSVGPAPSNALLQRRAPVVNLNASLLDAAQFAVDQRFGEDRPLTLEDLPGLLPVALTDVDNITLDYILNMSRYPNIHATQIGESLEGRPIFGLLMTNDGQYHPERPTIMFTCSQHGNEPSGGEACLILIEYFTHGVDEFANRIRNELNIAINPLANPDGKQANRRGNYEQTDINRDHMNLATFEGRAIHLLANMYRPLIGLDLHEFGGAGAPPPVQPPIPVTTWNTFQVGQPHGFMEADRQLYAHNTELMLRINDGMNQRFGYGSSSYYVGGTSLGSDPSVHRHHFILRNSYSYLFETGGGLGVINLPLRVNSHLEASFIVINFLFDNMQTMVNNQRTADQTAQQRVPGIQGWAIPPQENTEKAMNFLGMHGVNYTILDQDTSYPLVVDYRAGPNTVPTSMSFPNGTVVVTRWQVLGRLAHELFEFDDETYYNKGPRAWPLEAYRIMQVP